MGEIADLVGAVFEAQNNRAARLKAEVERLEAQRCTPEQRQLIWSKYHALWSNNKSGTYNNVAWMELQVLLQQVIGISNPVSPPPTPPPDDANPFRVGS